MSSMLWATSKCPAHQPWRLLASSTRSSHHLVQPSTCPHAYAVSQLCPILWDPMGCSPPDSPILGILKVRILEWLAISSSSGSFQLRDWTHISWVSCIGRQILYHWATWEAPYSGKEAIKVSLKQKALSDWVEEGNSVYIGQRHQNVKTSGIQCIENIFSSFQVG